MKVKIKLGENGLMPRKATDGAAAYDVYVPIDTQVEEGRQIIPLNIRLELPLGYEAMIEPRSGFSSKGMQGCLSIRYINDVAHLTGDGRFDCDVLQGKVDADYRGIIGVIIHNRDRRFIIPKGTRIAQLTIRKVENVEFDEVEVLTDTKRGEGGFGHTNEK